MSSSTDEFPSTKTAIITGACSGIGLAVTRHLLSQSSPRWKVVLADINSNAYDSIKSTLDTARHMYIPTDVASWESQASLFEQAYAWSNGCIDFFHANAGIADRESVSQPFDLDAPPTKPNLACLDININGVFYGLKLFVHYTRKTRRALSTASTAQDVSRSAFNPKMIITASGAGQYPFPLASQYAASKAGCVNLTRSAAPSLHAQDNIALNCIMPALLATGLMPKELLDQWPPGWITPTTTICRAVDELISPTGRIASDGKSDGVDGVVKFGQSVEVALDRLYYRTHVPFPEKSQEFLYQESYPGGLWERALAPVFAARARGGG